jgi:hypothetical protein
MHQHQLDASVRQTVRSLQNQGQQAEIVGMHVADALAAVRQGASPPTTAGTFLLASPSYHDFHQLGYLLADGWDVQVQGHGSGGRGVVRTPDTVQAQ